MNHLRTDVFDSAPYGAERDACALYMCVRKRGRSTFGTLKRALNCLSTMGHRTGFVNGEGDGAGIQTDIPRRLWALKLSRTGLRSTLATHPGFWVGHLLVPAGLDYLSFRDQLHDRFHAFGLDLLLEMEGDVRPQVLGRNARLRAPSFWQLAGIAEYDDVEMRLLQVGIALEAELDLHFASLSSHSVVYKVYGSVETLPHYYPELQDRTFDTAMALCHARYSTNTVSTFERTQPFALLGHNGEINTISRFRQEARQIGVQLVEGGSDSQDIDRTLHTLCTVYGYDLAEAMEIVFPPVPHELSRMSAPMNHAYTQLRNAYGPYAQGPAAIVARYADTTVASLDALGLRPLWFIETEKELILSSERGAIPLESMVGDPQPLAPGEKLALKVQRGQRVDVLDHDAIRQQTMHTLERRSASGDGSWFEPYGVAFPASSPPETGPPPAGPSPQATPVETVVATREEPSAAPSRLVMTEPVPLPWKESAVPALNSTSLAALGWGREHLQEIKTIVRTGKDPVGSLGHDGPLAVLSQNRVNVADYFKESVAVVTNPSIDRGREMEVFSTSTLVGTRPSLNQSDNAQDCIVALPSPLLPGGHPDQDSGDTDHAVAHQFGTFTIEELLQSFGDRVGWLDLAILDGETTHGALQRIADRAVTSIEEGAQCLVLDDTALIRDSEGWLDPHLAVGYLDETLRAHGADPNLRRRAGIVVRSGSLRTLHDIVLLVGLGADAVNPYAMLATAMEAHTARPLTDSDEIIEAQFRVMRTMNMGLEKVISTIGCHELRGYGRVSSTIGLSAAVAEWMNVANFLGSDEAGLNTGWLDRQAALRRAELRGDEKRVGLAKVDRLYPKFWKTVESCAMGEVPYDVVREKYIELTTELPIALRHLLSVRHLSDEVPPETVDISIGDYAMPLVIGAMSFGSQGALSHHAYAQAAADLEIICVNGEGGEPLELMGVYKHYRGQQVASGRFGVNAAFLNSAAIIEIKIGQGAKPGEGGMLPGYKVTAEVAKARRTTPGVALLSPSNNHDLYSIEDLAQLIEELKTVNPEARISVKCPVVPEIGMIAVGVAKAGADIINLTGYDGATGAARRHALQYVGLPAEIGVVQAHRALLEAGLRANVELWCDGGMKTGEDVVKMVLLGANRVGFATMAMVSIGCTICRKCHEGTCHVGITTHITTVEEADEKGLKSFRPRNYHHSVEGIARVFNGIADEIRTIVAGLGFTNLQDLVGRADLLEQQRWTDVIDLSPILQPVVDVPPTREPGIGRLLTRPRNHLTQFISQLVTDAIKEGDRLVTYQDEVMAVDRALGAHLAGMLMREPAMLEPDLNIRLRFGPSSVGGNGFAAWMIDGMDIVIQGGAQDGVAKGASGGRVAVMKGLNHNGERIDGSVGKSFAYGAQGGILIVQGNADSRACIRLSGADVILGGEISEPLRADCSVGMQANIKGFACEYMTSGRVIILGDPGPTAFAGMTGGTVYQLLTPSMGMTYEALEQRIARGAQVRIETLGSSDIADVQELLGYYIDALEETSQHDMSQRIRQISDAQFIVQWFVKVVPDIPGAG